MLEKAAVLLPLPCLLWLSLPCQGTCTHQNRLAPGRQSQNSPHTIRVLQRQNKKPDYLLRLNAASQRPLTSLLTADHQERTTHQSQSIRARSSVSTLAPNFPRCLSTSLPSKEKINVLHNRAQKQCRKNYAKVVIEDPSN